MKQLHLLLSLLFATNLLFSQVVFEKRIEIELHDDYKKEKVIVFDEEGTMMFSWRKKGGEKGKEEYRFEKYNTDLELTDTKDFAIDNDYYFEELTKTDDRLFLLFHDWNGKYILAHIGIDDMVVKKIDGEIPKKARVRTMKVMGDYVYSKANIKKKQTVIIFNWKTGKLNVIPIEIEGYKKKKVKIKSLQVLEEANEVLIYIVAIDSKKKSDLFVLKMDEEGESKGMSNLTKTIDYNIADISSKKLNDNTYVQIGTYSDNKIYDSQGLFFSQTSNDDVDFIEFYNFLDLTDFLSYLPEKKEKKIEKKKEKKKAKGKEMKINYKIADHEITEIEDGYLFIGEAYFQTYIHQIYTTYMYVNGQSTPRTNFRNVFDGYRYTHAIVAKFDKNGKMVWDKNFDLSQTNKPYFVKKFINVSESDDKGVKLVFSSGNKLVSKYISYDGEILKEKEIGEIETSFEGDKTKRSYSNLFYWYDNYFLTFGNQKIKNKENESVDKKRRVIFLNKIKY